MIVIVFAFAFGLSMDYEVFLLRASRNTATAGIRRTRPFGTGLQRSRPDHHLCGRAHADRLRLLRRGQGRGTGTDRARPVCRSLIDATIVRCLLVPAAMMLLGDAAWWAPAPLRRLHDRYGIHETV